MDLEEYSERLRKWDEIFSFVKEQSEKWVGILGFAVLAVVCLAGIVFLVVLTIQLSVQGVMNIKESISS